MMTLLWYHRVQSETPDIVASMTKMVVVVEKLILLVVDTTKSRWVGRTVLLDEVGCSQEERTACCWVSRYQHWAAVVVVVVVGTVMRWMASTTRVSCCCWRVYIGGIVVAAA